MLFKPEYDENGKKILCEMNGINSEMLIWSASFLTPFQVIFQEMIDKFVHFSPPL